MGGKVRISARHGSGLRELFRAIHRAHAPRRRRCFSTSETTRAVEAAYNANPPPVVRGHRRSCVSRHPGGENPPTFVVHGTRLKSLSATYQRYLENFFRKRFKLVGTPIRFVFKGNRESVQGQAEESADRAPGGEEAPADEAREAFRERSFGRSFLRILMRR